jgi:poly(hydroxyalkanoate) depolymerase family esterase
MRSIPVLLVLAGTAAADIQPVGNFGPNPGALAMFEYIPSQLGTKRPLVVVLHGCTQQATGVVPAGWNALADQHDFAVLYPEQATANNPVRCFNWAGEHGDPANLVRGQGENASIIAMIDHAIATHDLDPDRVFITGLSAGGAFTSVMLATWPERFAGGAIFAGIPYRCATTVGQAFTCGNPGVVKAATTWGDLVRGAAPGPYPRVQIWHGSADTTVAPANATELVKQWTDAHDTDATADTTEMIDSAMREQFLAGDRIVVERYTIAGMGHAIPIGGDGCVATPGAYLSDRDICSTQHAATFFGLTGEDPPTDNDDDSDGNDEDDVIHEESPSGGCSTSGGAGLGVLALFLLARRRR